MPLARKEQRTCSRTVRLPPKSYQIAWARSPLPATRYPHPTGRAAPSATQKDIILAKTKLPLLIKSNGIPRQRCTHHTAGIAAGVAGWPSPHHAGKQHSPGQSWRLHGANWRLLQRVEHTNVGQRVEHTSCKPELAMIPWFHEVQGPPPFPHPAGSFAAARTWSESPSSRSSRKRAMVSSSKPTPTRPPAAPHIATTRRTGPT